MVNEFKVGDKVANDMFGNGVVDELSNMIGLKGNTLVKFEGGAVIWCDPNYLRPRNFLLKIAEEQEAKKPDSWEKLEQTIINEVFKPSAVGVDPAYGDGIAGQMVMTKSGLKEFITDAYGIKRDPVTLLEIESDGLVKISSIRDSVRETS